MAGDSVTLWVSGEVVSEEEARVSAVDHGITVGDGVFETCKVTDGQPFALRRHLRRLERSARILDLECPPEEDVRSAAAELLASVGPMPMGRLRITLTGGPGPLGTGRGGAVPTLLLAVSPRHPWPQVIKVVGVPWTRNERSAVVGAKTTSYAENLVALRAAQQRGAHEALLLNTQGLVCEGTGSNVAVERGGLIVTPPLASGCLAGITRELLLEWATEEGLPVIEDDVTPSDLAGAPEVLLMSSTRDVQHVADLDGRSVPGTALGRAVAEMFVRRAADGIDP